MRGLTIGILFVFSVFAAQLLRIQGFDASAVSARALEDRQETVAIPSLRGKVLSQDGVVLAASRDRVTVVADPTAVCTYGTGQRECDATTSSAAVARAVSELAPLLGTDPLELQALLSKEGTRYSILERKVSPLTWRKVAALKIPGIYADRRQGVVNPERVYPQGPTTASLVGFVRDDGVAGGGVEYMLDGVLKGTTGKAVFERAPDGSRIPTGREEVTEAVDGKDVTLTINSDLQWYAQNALAQKVQQSQAASGTIVVMDARTGALLTVASYPTFDPNDPGHVKGSMANLAFADAFEPGSTAKVMTVAAALEEKAVTPSTPVIIPNRIFRTDTWFKDSHDHPTEYRTVAGALAESSNLGTVLIGERMPSKTLERYFRTFGVGAKSGVGGAKGFPAEQAGGFPPSEKWSDTQRATVMFGQGVSVTAIQAASVFQTIANDGVRMPAQLVAGTTDDDGDLVRSPQGEGVRVIRPGVAAQVSEMLEGVVSKEGTAPQAQVPGYRVAGKTGTADRYDERVGKYRGKTASFIGYAPADDPQLVVAVIIQNPVRGYYGGSTAGPVFKDVMTYALQALKVPPTGTTRPSLTLEVDKAQALSDPNALRDTEPGPPPR